MYVHIVRGIFLFSKKNPFLLILELHVYIIYILYTDIMELYLIYTIEVKLQINYLKIRDAFSFTMLLVYTTFCNGKKNIVLCSCDHLSVIYARGGEVMVRLLENYVHVSDPFINMRLLLIQSVYKIKYHEHLVFFITVLNPRTAKPPTQPTPTAITLLKLCVSHHIYMYIALSHYRNNLFVEQIAYIIQVHFTLSYRHMYICLYIPRIVNICGASHFYINKQSNLYSISMFMDIIYYF